MKEAKPVVYVVGDDAAVRQALDSLIRSIGFDVQTFSSAQEFLHSNSSSSLGCLVLDVRLPGLSGLDLQCTLLEARVALPVIFVTGHRDIPMSVQAMKASAVEFFTNPFRDEELVADIQQAIERARAVNEKTIEVTELRQRAAFLTPREREVMHLVVAGLLNKQIALHLGNSEVTVKLQRAQVMRKMEAKSLADLVRMAGKLAN